MSKQRRRRWYYPWIPLGLVTGLVAAVVALLLLNHPTQQAQGAPLPKATAGFQDKDKLLLTVNLPPVPERKQAQVQLELLDSEGKVLSQVAETVTLMPLGSSQRVELPALKPDAGKVTVRCLLDKQEFKVPLSDILLVKPHETNISAGQEFFANSPAALRCQVHGVKSLNENIPLAHAAVEVKLKNKTGKSIPLYEGKTGENGVAAVEFAMPSLPPGDYKMEVVTRSTLGEEKLERDIKVKTAPKILLVSDKPLYQPGQTMHLRALALQSHDLTPVAQKELVFEVEDPKGNKVFKRTFQTTDHGIANVDFQLASEVNTGDYHIRASLGDVRSEKTVSVKPYVLPKFKADLKADKKFYLPKETINAELQADYFFGKPVAGAQVKVTASTFDVAFKDFATWNGKTDANGHAKFDIKLPDSFVGQPLDKGNALVKLEVKFTDSADHSETITRTYPVSNQPVQLSLIPEGGRLVPGLENRVFAAAIYPDGSPAVCDVYLWLGQQKKDKPFASLKTNEAGLAEFKVTPRAEQFRQGGWVQRQIEMLGGKAPQIGGNQNLFDLFAEAKDNKGNAVHTTVALTSEPLGANVLLRLDKAIYKGGESPRVNIHTSAGLPTVYLDVVRAGQTLLTRWLDVKDGKADYKLDLPPSVFGSLEIHAYQLLASGEIIRDSRVVYVNPASDLKIEVKADKDVYLPGDKGQIRFQVTDAAGKPTAAALGVLIVDEAVYALQEMQPGLEKVYFTLQEELLKPQAQIVYKPSEGLDTLVRQPQLGEAKQQVAEVLLTAVKPKPPARWEHNPDLERRHKMEQQWNQLGGALFDYASGNEFLIRDQKTKVWQFSPKLLDGALKMYGWNENTFTDPFGGKLRLETLPQWHKDFNPNNLGRVITQQRLQNLYHLVVNHAAANREKWFKDGKWLLPESRLQQSTAGQPANFYQDAWGKPIKLLKRDKKVNNPLANPVMDNYELVSAGPDGKFETADDIRITNQQHWMARQTWWLDQDQLGLLQKQLEMPLMQRPFGGPVQFNMPVALTGFAPPPGLPGQGGGAIPRPVPVAAPAPATAPPVHKAPPPQDAGAPETTTSAPAAQAPITRMREYFPETLLWQPGLITDDKGVAVMPLTFADSITTWRLTASANSKGGLLGGVSAPLRVFQDFFADLDLPLNLTQNDEVAFPVAVYNYLKTPQTVKLELQPEPWFELTDGLGLSRTLDLKPNEVTAVKFRIRAKSIGFQPLTVKAIGSKMSDALKRVIEVVPDGKKMEQVVTDRLLGKVTQTITIPENALPDASKLLVKVYPGVLSQVLEGTEAMLRLPGGCFEQTSSSAYPNILVVDYLKKTKKASPEIMLRAEQYLNVGYQRLLTFERPGGGFDWWGSGEPLVWLSAYGLHEFNDMARVYPIDKAIIDRTQRWLLKQQAADGTWSKIGATHGESIERMGDPKLLLTSYVTWSLLDSGLKTPELKKSIEYIRDGIKTAENAYILALAANALAAWDAQDDSTHEALSKVLKKLESKKHDLPDWKAISFPAGGQSLAYARGDSLTVETTALAVLAMVKSGQFTNQVNQALTFLMKSKDAHGGWGSTQATILTLKALIASAGGPPQKGTAWFTIRVNGKEAARGEVNEHNADVLQLFDLKEHTQQAGKHEVAIEVDGETGLQYSLVARHFEPWTRAPEVKPVLDVSVAYDRTKLSTADLLRARATLKYNGPVPTYQVIVDLGIPPGFTADPGDFAEMVAAKKIQRFSVTARQVTLYLGDIKPGDTFTFDYSLKPRYPIKAKTPTTVAYEYYTPANRAEAKPVELTVEDKK